MAVPAAPLTQIGFGRTARRDRWWAQPLLTVVVLGTFVVYTTWAAFQGEHYRFGNYLSPFYSPELFGSANAWFGRSAPPAARRGQGRCARSCSMRRCRRTATA